MTILLIVLLFVSALSAASALGWTVDSRDSAYGLGPVTAQTWAMSSQPSTSSGLRGSGPM